MRVRWRSGCCAGGCRRQIQLFFLCREIDGKTQQILRGPHSTPVRGCGAHSVLPRASATHSLSPTGKNQTRRAGGAQDERTHFACLPRQHDTPRTTHNERQTPNNKRRTTNEQRGKDSLWAAERDIISKKKHQTGPNVQLRMLGFFCGRPRKTREIFMVLMLFVIWVGRVLRWPILSHFFCTKKGESKKDLLNLNTISTV